mgnify:CR=1 FL=1|tara:strand:+ start:42017 stop:43240 length:1224 start_codon:yes stop_codon:yes gene_type:complete
MKNFLCYLIALIFLSTACSTQQKIPETKVKTGAEVLIESYLPDLAGKRVGLVINHTARVGQVHVLDTLIASGVIVTSIFAPEHGYRGDRADGELIKTDIDRVTGLPVFSLYGSDKRPTKKMMDSVDILLFDMQDVGARFYTYNSTMKNILEAGAEFEKEVWILDRPNPAGGEYVAGWILENEFESFVGSYPIPIAHGLTLGELALMAVGEGWLDKNSIPKLRVIEMKGWNRTTKWPETGLEWIPPSPNLPDFENAYTYLGTCFFEGVNISEGRGTDNPFLKIGSPLTQFLPEELENLSKKYGMKIDTVSFIPRSIPGKSLYPKFEGEHIYGVSLSPTSEFNKPVEFGLDLLKLFEDKMNSQNEEYIVRDHFFLLSGTSEILNWDGKVQWGPAFDEYLTKRKKYFLYD